jgi:hypothetical protein
LEQRIGRNDRYGQHETPQVYHFAPDKSATAYAADMGFMGRVATKIMTVRRDLGSANQVIAEEIQQHYTGGRIHKRQEGRGGRQRGDHQGAGRRVGPQRPPD